MSKLNAEDIPTKSWLINKGHTAERERRRKGGNAQRVNMKEQEIMLISVGIDLPFGTGASIRGFKYKIA